MHRSHPISHDYQVFLTLAKQALPACKPFLHIHSTCFQTLFEVHCLTIGISACQPGLTPTQSWQLPLLDYQSISLCTLRVYGACQQTITENKIH